MIKDKLLGILVVLACHSLMVAQATQQQDKERQERGATEAAFNNRVDKLRNVGKNNIIRDRYKESREYQAKLKQLSRKLTVDEEALLIPDARDRSRFEKQIASKNWGLTKLILDRGCAENPRVVVSNEHCLKYGMPGAGSSYSFRNSGYRIKRLSDVSFTNAGFDTTGIMKHGVLVDIGNVSIEDITVSNEKLTTLTGFQPASTTGQATNFAANLKKGVSGGGLFYSSTLPVKMDTTYALRSIAYRGNNPRRVDDITYGVLEFDKRADILVVFRVVRIEADQSATILWKVLQTKKSPKLKSGK